METLNSSGLRLGRRRSPERTREDFTLTRASCNSRPRTRLDFSRKTTLQEQHPEFPPEECFLCHEEHVVGHRRIFACEDL